MLSKYTRTAFCVSIACWGATFSIACSSGDEEEGGINGAGNNGSGASAGTSNVVVPGNGGGGNAITGMHDGGSILLTPAEVDAIGASACTGWATEGENLPAVLQLVVDVSGSMEEEAPSTNGQSKWSITHDALANAIGTLPDSVSLGVLYYPNQDTPGGDTPSDVSECVNVDELVSIDVLGNNRQAVLDSLDQAETGNFTPTHDAYRYALAQSLLPYETTQRKFMLLITDGAPTLRQDCIGDTQNVMDQPTQPIIDEVAGAYAAGIQTFIIGSPGSEESEESNTDMRPWLSQAAQAGGTAAAGCANTGPAFCHMDMTQAPDFSAALANGLATVVGQVVDSCTFAIPLAPDGSTINPNETNLIINWTNGESTLILPDNTGDCSEGWQFTGTDQVTLCAGSCSAIQADAGARVQLTFGCTVDEVIPVR